MPVRLKLPGLPFNPVILSAAETSRSEVSAESKDPCPSRPAVTEWARAYGFTVCVTVPELPVKSVSPL